MNQFKKRLDALEQAEQSQPAHNARMSADLMLTYASKQERAQWEAAGRPALDLATWTQVLDAVYTQKDVNHGR